MINSFSSISFRINNFLRDSNASCRLIVSSSITSPPASSTAASWYRVVNTINPSSLSGRYLTIPFDPPAQEPYNTSLSSALSTIRSHRPAVSALKNFRTSSFTSSLSSDAWSIFSFLAMSAHACSKLSTLRAGTQKMENSGRVSLTV